MATNQELIEQNIRILIGDLQLQLVFAKAQIQTLEQVLNNVSAKAKESEAQVDMIKENLDKHPILKTNGAAAPAE